MLMYTSSDPLSSSFDDSKDWNSQPISSRHVISQPSANAIRIEDPCDASVNMTLTAKSPHEANEWRLAIEAEIHEQITAYANAVRVSRLYPGDLLGRPLNVLGAVQKCDVSVFIRIQSPGLGDLNVYKKSNLNTREGSEGPPCFWRGADNGKNLSLYSDPYVVLLSIYLSFSLYSLFSLPHSNKTHTHTHTHATQQIQVPTSMRSNRSTKTYRLCHVNWKIKTVTRSLARCCIQTYFLQSSLDEMACNEQKQEAGFSCSVACTFSVSLQRS